MAPCSREFTIDTGVGGALIGDILVGIDGRRAADIPLGQVRMMFGQHNSYVLRVRRGSEERTVHVSLSATL